MKPRSALVVSILAACVSTASAQTASAPATTAPTSAAAVQLLEETKEQRDVRMKWWREARFGMFIHWGIYSVPAGTYDGKQINGIGEWIMNRGKIPVDRYAKYAEEFNPTKYDAEAWVKLAKEAGMKYVVITSKHHDGFAMFGSKVSRYNIVDATPFKRDALKELADACKKHDMKLGFYYSQAQDWHHPGGSAAGGHWDKAQDGDMDKYLDEIAVPQVKEILSNYGPVSVLWWDTSIGMTPERAAKFFPLLKLQPGIITNNRLGGGVKGDTETPEQFIPATGYKDRDWETCMTMNGTWGYKSYDTNWKSTEKLIHNLVDIASKGGNYLLNVGPTAEGEIPQASVERLREMGAWMKTNGEAIYGTSASPFKPEPWGRCTRRDNADGTTTLYLHVFEWPEDGQLLVPVRNRIESAALLSDASRTFTSQMGPDGRVLALSGAAPDKVASVIKVKLQGAPQVIPQPIRAGKDGVFSLALHEAERIGAVYREKKGKSPAALQLGRTEDMARWTIGSKQAGAYDLVITYAAEKAQGGELQVGLNGATTTVKLPSTSGEAGRATARVLLNAGGTLLTMRPKSIDGAALVEIRDVQIKPAARPAPPASAPETK